MARTRDADRWEPARRRLRELSPGRRRLVVAGLVLGGLSIWYLGMLAGKVWLLGDDLDWTYPVPGMIGGLVGGGGALWLRSRRMGGFRQLGEYDRALRRGRLPDDADPAVWRARLDGAQRSQRWARPLATGLMAVSTVVLVIAFASVDLGWVALVATVLVGLVMVAVVGVSSRRQSGRIERLQEQVRSLPDPGPLRPGG